MLGRNDVFTLTGEQHVDYEHGRIDRELLASRVKDFAQFSYVCGPPSMVDDVTKQLDSLGTHTSFVVVEES